MVGRRLNGGVRLAQSLEELGLVNRNGRHVAEKCCGVYTDFSKQRIIGMRVNHRAV